MQRQRNSRWLIASVTLASISLCTNSFAASDEKLLNMCKACHGQSGNNPFPSIPNLAQQNSQYMVAQLTAFKNGQRQDKTMSKVAKLLTTEQMQQMAHYFSKGKD